MGLILFGLMIAVPILEIGVFIVIGRFIGLWPTLAGILLTALIGSAIIRHQGLAIITKARRTIDAGQAPVGEVVEGVALLVAGVLLLTPGFVTDSLGFLLLVPGLRRRIAAAMLAQAMRRAETRVHAGGGGFDPQAGGSPGGRTRGGPGGARRGGGVVIDGEYTELSESPVNDRDRADGSDPGEAPPPPSGGWGRPSGRNAQAENDADLSPPAQRARG